MAGLSPRRSGVRASSGFRRPWVRSDRPVPRLVVRPVERFLRLEAGSASLLISAAVVAVVWANLGADSYERLWSTTVGIDLGPLSIEEDLRAVVNDLLMAIFFYVVALEVKREAVSGSLRDRRAAAVPVAAALGTMVGAGVVYVAVNLDGGELRGWAIPIATDIAFALGVLGLAGRRAPRELRVFLLTLAVVDDLGTIVVIALFYSSGLSGAWIGVAVGAALAVVVLGRLGVRLLVPYVVLAGVLWLAVFESGVHATIAGVVLGFLTPAVAFHRREQTAELIGSQLAELTQAEDEINQSTMWETSRLAREAVSPLERIEDQLHPWTAFFVLPVFALANAGIELSLSRVGEAFTEPVGLGIILGLVVGAPLGGLLFAWLSVRLTRARLPDGLDWSAIGTVTPLKGVGFTVAIFISVLALDDQALRDQATLAVLAASLIAAVVGFAALQVRYLLVRQRDQR